jgi:methionyl-tRNA formyltransferase
MNTEKSFTWETLSMSRLVFLGTPAAAVPSLRALVDAGHDVRLVVSRRDTRRSRRGDPEPSPVKRAALDLGLEVTDKLDQVTEADAELGVVVAYGRIIPGSILEVLPMVNVHFSLLPRWRGAAPVERAILAGDPTTGVCVMRLEAGLDTGPVLSRAEVPIDPEETAEELKERLSVLGAQVLADTLSVGTSELSQGDPQSGEVTYAAKIEPEELELHFDEPAIHLARLVRVGRAWTTFRNSRLIVVSARVSADGSGAARELPPGALDGTSVVTGDGELELIEVQPEGRKRIAADEWRRGARPQRGELLGHK